MNKLSLLAGMAIGAVLTAGVAQLQAQAPQQPTPRARRCSSSRNRHHSTRKIHGRISAQGAAKTIKDNGGRFIVRTNEVTGLAGDAPKRVVITGWELMDEVKKWQGSKEYKDLQPLRDQVLKVRQFAVATCENPQGAKPGQTKCP